MLVTATRASEMLAVSTALLSFAPHTFTTPTIEIAPGVHLPLVGIGTWQYNDSVTEAAVLSALSMGYEHIDTAAGYANADGVARALEKSGRARASYFITSKVPGGLNASAAAAALDANLAALRLTHVDLMLVHFPARGRARARVRVRVRVRVGVGVLCSTRQAAPRPSV